VSTYPLVDTNLGAHQGHHSYPSTPRPDGPGMTLTLKQKQCKALKALRPEVLARELIRVTDC